MNYNVDKRALYGRWKEPGQVTPFKRLGTFRYDDDPLSRQEMTKGNFSFRAGCEGIDLGIVERVL